MFYRIFRAKPFIRCWLVVNWTLENNFQWNLNRNATIFMHQNQFESACRGHFVSVLMCCVDQSMGSNWWMQTLELYDFYQPVNTLRLRHSGLHFADNIFQCIYRHLRDWKCAHFDHSFPKIPKTHCTTSQNWFRSWHGTKQVTSRYVQTYAGQVYWRINESPGFGFNMLVPSLYDVDGWFRWLMHRLWN